MVYRSLFNATLFLVLCNASPLFSKEIELFSIDYDKKGATKINALENKICLYEHDEEKTKKEAEITEIINLDTKNLEIAITELDQRLKKLQPKKEEIMAALKKSDVNKKKLQEKIRQEVLLIKKMLQERLESNDK
jgi:hypothetical protein